MHGTEGENSGLEPEKKDYLLKQQEESSLSHKRDQGILSGKSDNVGGTLKDNTEVREQSITFSRPISISLQSLTLKELYLQRGLKHTSVWMTDCLLRYFTKKLRGSKGSFFAEGTYALLGKLLTETL